MIKCHTFRFEKLNVPSPWVGFASFGNLLSDEGYRIDSYKDCPIRLDENKVYQMSLDQSSSNTGIFIKDLHNTEAHMIEVLRNRNRGIVQDAGDYMWDLEMFMHSLGAGCTFSHLLYERPINSEYFRSAQVLFQLEGMLRSLSHRYPEFKSAKVDNIENSSWRSTVIDKSLSSMYSRKELSRFSVLNIWPWMEKYGPSLYKDNDIFEAIGVMMGWFYASFDPLGRPYVRGDRTTRTIGGYVLPGLPGERVKAVLDEQGIESELFIENPKYAVYQNLAAMVRPHRTSCVEFTTKYTMLCLCIECNIKWIDPDYLTVILVDAATVDTKLNEITGGTFHFVL